MEKYNICKFNSNRSSDLVCENFIYESNLAQSAGVRAENYVINIVINGDGTLNVNGKSYPISKGTVFFILKSESFSVTSDTSLAYSYISFNGRRAEEYILRLGIAGDNRIFERCDRLIPFWMESIAMCDDGNIDVLSEAVFLYSIAVLMPEKKERDDFVSEIMKITHENFADPDISIVAIAEAMSYSPKYLSTIFKKKVGMSFTEYLRELRIKHAIFLMENGVVSVKNVALLCGYKDALYFSKLFSASEGISPKAYIDKQQKEHNTKNN